MNQQCSNFTCIYKLHVDRRDEKTYKPWEALKVVFLILLALPLAAQGGTLYEKEKEINIYMQNL